MIHVKITKADIPDYRSAYIVLLQACKEAGPGQSICYYTGPHGTVPDAMRRAVSDLYERKIAYPTTKLTPLFRNGDRVWEHVLQVRWGK